MTKRIFISADHGMAIVRDESLAQYMEILRIIRYATSRIYPTSTN